jgi:tetratricopeptide (TPR) repeat protein
VISVVISVAFIIFIAVMGALMGDDGNNNYAYGNSSNLSNLDSAKTNLQSGNYSKAIAFANEHIAIDSIDYKPFIIKSISYSFISPDSVMNPLEEVLVNDDLYYKSGVLRDISDRYNEYEKKSKPIVIKHINSCLDSLISDPDLYYKTLKYTSEAIRVSDKASAVKMLNSAKKKLPKETRINRLLGDNYVIDKDYRNAIKEYEKFIKKDENVNVRVALGDMYLEQKSKSKAKKHYKKAMELGNQHACEQYRELTAITRYNTISRCCDGSSSYSTGRGTCSHHGGVCRTEREPYKEYQYNCK